MQIAAIFPGQGSQIVGMGEALSEQFPEARDLFRAADHALGFALSELCFKGPLERLTLTEFAQPAILAASYASYVLLGKKPQLAAGHSLGEYTALVAAGALDFQEALLLVHKRGRYMQEAVRPGAGKMVAVLGVDDALVEQVIAETSSGIKEIANLNCPGQVVVAGDVTGVDAFVQQITNQQGAKVIPLNVSAPFHCSLMKPAAEKLAKDLDATTFNDPEFPIYANVSAEPVTSGTVARDLLKRQVCASVRWTESVENMVSLGGITHTIEFGPGGVLSKLVKRINKDLKRFEVYDPETLETTRAAL